MSVVNIPTSASGYRESIVAEAAAAQRVVNRMRMSPTLNPAGIVQPLGKITNSASEFQKSMDASAARVFAFGAAVGVINGISDAFFNIVQSAAEVEKSLKDIQVVMETTDSAMAKFGEGLFDVARNTATSFSAVAESATELARQGLSAEETLARVNSALILSRLSGLDTVKSTETLTAAINSFNEEGITHTQIVNRMANVDAAFAVSSADLAEALSRAGAVAQSSGVEFNELAAVVTAVQQRTARGGSVIGNGFKSIFTRIKRSGVREALEEIGVATRNLDGTFRGGMDIILDYANVYKNLSDSQKAYTAEQLAGVYQIQNLQALIQDLNSGYSIYNDALNVANNTTNEATKRNEELNKTLSALFTQTSLSAKELASSIGDIAFSDNFKEILTFLNNLAKKFNEILSEDSGSNLAKNLISGIGSFLTGPGMVILGAAFIKIFGLVTKFAKEAFSDILGLNSETKRQQGLQAAISQILTTNSNIYQKILAAGSNTAKQEQIILNTIKQETAERLKQEALIKRIAASSRLIGVGATDVGFVPMGKRSSRAKGKKTLSLANGFLPAFEKESLDVSRGIGGARKGDKPVKTKIKMRPGQSSDVVVNTGEWIVKNFKNSGADAVFNRDMAKQYGLPSGAKKVNAADGYIPNFSKQKYGQGLSGKTYSYSASKLGGFDGGGSIISQYADLTDVFTGKLNVHRMSRDNDYFKKEANKIVRGNSQIQGLIVRDPKNKDPNLTKYKINPDAVKRIKQTYGDLVKSGSYKGIFKSAENIAKRPYYGKRPYAVHQAFGTLTGKAKGLVGEMESKNYLAKSGFSDIKFTGKNAFMDLTARSKKNKSEKSFETKATTEQNIIVGLKKAASEWLLALTNSQASFNQPKIGIKNNKTDKINLTKGGRTMFSGGINMITPSDTVLRESKITAKKKNSPKDQQTENPLFPHGVNFNYSKGYVPEYVKNLTKGYVPNFSKSGVATQRGFVSVQRVRNLREGKPINLNNEKLTIKDFSSEEQKALLGFKARYNKDVMNNQAIETKRKRNQINTIDASRQATMLVARNNVRQKVDTIHSPKDGNKTRIKYRIEGIKNKNLQGTETKTREKLKNLMLGESKKLASELSGGRFASNNNPITKMANAGSVGSAAGAVFETALSSIGKNKLFSQNNATFDISGFPDKALQSLFGYYTPFADAKIGISQGTKGDFVQKVLKLPDVRQKISETDKQKQQEVSRKTRKEFGPSRKKLPNMSKGFVPNFMVKRPGFGRSSNVYDMNRGKERVLNVRHIRANEGEFGSSIYKKLIKEIESAAKSGRPYTKIDAGSVIGPRIPRALLSAKKILDRKRLSKNIPKMQMEGVFNPVQLRKRVEGFRQENYYRESGKFKTRDRAEYLPGEERKLIKSLRQFGLGRNAHKQDKLVRLENLWIGKNFSKGFIPNYAMRGGIKRVTSIRNIKGIEDPKGNFLFKGKKFKEAKFNTPDWESSKTEWISPKYQRVQGDLKEVESFSKYLSTRSDIPPYVSKNFNKALQKEKQDLEAQKKRDYELGKKIKLGNAGFYERKNYYNNPLPQDRPFKVELKYLKKEKIDDIIQGFKQNFSEGFIPNFESNHLTPKYSTNVINHLSEGYIPNFAKEIGFGLEDHTRQALSKNIGGVSTNMNISVNKEGGILKDGKPINFNNKAVINQIVSNKKVLDFVTKKVNKQLLDAQRYGTGKSFLSRLGFKPTIDIEKQQLGQNLRSVAKNIKLGTNKQTGSVQSLDPSFTIGKALSNGEHTLQLKPQGVKNVLTKFGGKGFRGVADASLSNLMSTIAITKKGREGSSGGISLKRLSQNTAMLGKMQAAKKIDIKGSIIEQKDKIKNIYQDIGSSVNQMTTRRKDQLANLIQKFNGQSISRKFESLMSKRDEITSSIKTKAEAIKNMPANQASKIKKEILSLRKKQKNIKEQVSRIVNEKTGKIKNAPQSISDSWKNFSERLQVRQRAENTFNKVSNLGKKIFSPTKSSTENPYLSAIERQKRYIKNPLQTERSSKISNKAQFAFNKWVNESSIVKAGKSLIKEPRKTLSKTFSFDKGMKNPYADVDYGISGEKRKIDFSEHFRKAAAFSSRITGLNKIQKSVKETFRGVQVDTGKNYMYLPKKDAEVYSFKNQEIKRSFASNQQSIMDILSGRSSDPSLEQLKRLERNAEEIKIQKKALDSYYRKYAKPQHWAGNKKVIPKETGYVMRGKRIVPKKSFASGFTPSFSRVMRSFSDKQSSLSNLILKNNQQKKARQGLTGQEFSKLSTRIADFNKKVQASKDGRYMQSRPLVSTDRKQVFKISRRHRLEDLDNIKRFLNSKQFRVLPEETKNKLTYYYNKQKAKNSSIKDLDNEYLRHSASPNYRGKIRNFGNGFMPNFALDEAIERETKALKQRGISSNKIKVSKHSKLKNSMNPMGLAVINTVDEPMGVQQGINRSEAKGIDPKTHGVPSFAMTIEEIRERKRQEKFHLELDRRNGRFLSGSGLINPYADLDKNEAYELNKKQKEFKKRNAGKKGFSKFVSNIRSPENSQRYKNLKGKSGGLAMGAMFMGPMAAQMITDGRQGPELGGGASLATNALTGLSYGAAFGAPGMIVGGAGGAIKGMAEYGVKEDQSKTFKALAAAKKKLDEEFKDVSKLESFGQSLVDLKNSTEMGDVSGIVSANQQIRDSINSLSDPKQAQRMRELANSSLSTSEKLGILNRTMQEAQKNLTVQDQLIKMGQDLNSDEYSKPNGLVTSSFGSAVQATTAATMSVFGNGTYDFNKRMLKGADPMFGEFAKAKDKGAELNKIIDKEIEVIASDKVVQQLSDGSAGLGGFDLKGLTPEAIKAKRQEDLELDAQIAKMENEVANDLRDKTIKTLVELGSNIGDTEVGQSLKKYKGGNETVDNMNRFIKGEDGEFNLAGSALLSELIESQRKAAQSVDAYSDAVEKAQDTEMRLKNQKEVLISEYQKFIREQELINNILTKFENNLELASARLEASFQIRNAVNDFKVNGGSRSPDEGIDRRAENEVSKIKADSNLQLKSELINLVSSSIPKAEFEPSDESRSFLQGEGVKSKEKVLTGQAGFAQFFEKSTKESTQAMQDAYAAFLKSNEDGNISLKEIKQFIGKLQVIGGQGNAIAEKAAMMSNLSMQKLAIEIQKAAINRKLERAELGRGRLEGIGGRFLSKEDLKNVADLGDGIDVYRNERTGELLNREFGPRDYVADNTVDTMDEKALSVENARRLAEILGVQQQILTGMSNDEANFVVGIRNLEKVIETFRANNVSPDLIKKMEELKHTAVEDLKAVQAIDESIVEQTKILGEADYTRLEDPMKAVQNELLKQRSEGIKLNNYGEIAEAVGQAVAQSLNNTPKGDQPVPGGNGDGGGGNQPLVESNKLLIETSNRLNETNMLLLENQSILNEQMALFNESVMLNTEGLDTSRTLFEAVNETILSFPQQLTEQLNEVVMKHTVTGDVRFEFNNEAINRNLKPAVKQSVVQALQDPMIIGYLESVLAQRIDKNNILGGQ